MNERLWYRSGLIGTFAGILLLAGCAGTGESGQASATETQRQSTGVGNVEIFNIATADPNDVIDALLRDGRAILRGINFAFDSAELDGNAYASASRIGTILEQLPELRLAVVGHTDNTGDFQYNMGLSERRAQAIVSALRKDFSVGPERVVGVGVGPLAPITSNATDEDKAQNRRVELVVIN